MDAELATALPTRLPTSIGIGIQALILASIVEKGDRAGQRRAQIAGVFANGCKGMKLQTDPTVIYGMGDRSIRQPRRKDLLEDTPTTPTSIPGCRRHRYACRDVPLDRGRAGGRTLYFVAKVMARMRFPTLSEHNASRPEVSSSDNDHPTLHHC